MRAPTTDLTLIQRATWPLTTTGRKDGGTGVDPGTQVSRPKPSTVGNLAVSAIPLGDNPEQAAAYVAGLMAELGILVRRHHLGTLGYLLDMARLEAEEIVQRGEGLSGEGEPKHQNNRDGHPSRR